MTESSKHARYLAQLGIEDSLPPDERVARPEDADTTSSLEASYRELVRECDAELSRPPLGDREMDELTARIVDDVAGPEPSWLELLLRPAAPAVPVAAVIGMLAGWWLWGMREVPTPAHLELATGVQVQAPPAARVAYRERVDTHWLSVEDGWVDVDFQPANEKGLAVWTPGATVTVVGTRFRVEWRAAERDLHVAVHEGRVRVETADGEQTSLAAGESLARENLPLRERPPDDEPLPAPEEQPPTEDEPPTKARPEPRERGALPITDPYRKVEELLGERRFEEATLLLESTVTRASEGTSKRLMQLELARLYLRHRKTPERARPILEALSAGDDLVAEEARAMLEAL